MKEYKIHILLGDRLQTFTTFSYERKDGRITFYDKFGQHKDFSDDNQTLKGIETKESEQ